MSPLPVNKTGGTYGSNQYGPRGSSQADQGGGAAPPQAAIDLVQQLQPPSGSPSLPSVFDTGYSVRQPVWRAVANVVGDYPEDRETARRLAGHAWEPEEATLYTPGSDGEMLPVSGSKAIKRSDSKALLGVCASTRESIGIGDMYDLVENLVEQPGVHYEAGGTLGGGRQVWTMCKMDEPIAVPGDPSRTYAYLSVVNRLVGPGACSMQWTAMREGGESCVSLAELQGRPPLRYQLRHTKNWRNRSEEIKDAVLGVRHESDEWNKTASFLATKSVDGNQRKQFLAEFVPMPPEGIISDTVRDNVVEARGQISKILDSRSCDGIRDSAWGLVQASAEYLDHVRYYRSSESRFKRCLLRPEPLKRKAVEIAMGMK